MHPPSAAALRLCAESGPDTSLCFMKSSSFSVLGLGIGTNLMHARVIQQNRNRGQHLPLDSWVAACKTESIPYPIAIDFAWKLVSFVQDMRSVQASSIIFNSFCSSSKVCVFSSSSSCNVISSREPPRHPKGPSCARAPFLSPGPRRKALTLYPRPLDSPRRAFFLSRASRKHPAPTRQLETRARLNEIRRFRFQA